jgi:hypothetical protein
MKFEIAKTNGGQYALDIGNTRFNEYDDLKKLFEDLEKLLKLSKENLK